MSPFFIPALFRTFWTILSIDRGAQFFLVFTEKKWDILIYFDANWKKQGKKRKEVSRCKPILV